jgi:hypothetical protein
MQVYQKRLLQLLVQKLWELEEIDAETDWWAAEHWKMKSVGPAWGATVWITFLVDPMYRGREKAWGVWAMSAAVERPGATRSAQQRIAYEFVSGKGYDERARRFVEALNAARYGYRRADEENGQRES